MRYSGGGKKRGGKGRTIKRGGKGMGKAGPMKTFFSDRIMSGRGR